MEQILTGYFGLIDYIYWVLSTKGQVPSEEEEGPETYQSLTNAARAVENLRGILDYEGCFDIFLLKLLHILQFYGRLDEAEFALEEYLDKNPESLHAHIYLYTFRKQHDLKIDESAEILQKICKMDPSNTLVLDYVEYLHRHGNGPNVELFQVLANYLDYLDNRDSVEGWTWLCRAAVESKHRRNKELLSFLRQLWRERSSYWKPYHFSTSLNGPPQVWICKASIIQTLQVDGGAFLPAVDKRLSEVGENLLDKLRTFEENILTKIDPEDSLIL